VRSRVCLSMRVVVVISPAAYRSRWWIPVMHSVHCTHALIGLEYTPVCVVSSYSVRPSIRDRRDDDEDGIFPRRVVDGRGPLSILFAHTRVGSPR